MSFLGVFLEGQSVNISVRWTPAPGEPPITGSDLELTDPDGITTVLVGAATGTPNEWVARVEGEKSGTWEVEWTTTPPGGVSYNTIYFDPT